MQHDGLIYPEFGTRNQADTNRCTGHALATTIDIQRRLQALGGGDEARLGTSAVSADMLYHLARFQERQFSVTLPKEARKDPLSEQSVFREETGVRSLRSVIKAFYHYGVCLDINDRERNARDEISDHSERWESAGKDAAGNPIAGHRHDYPNVPQAIAARQRRLGTYYRLEPILNDYHSAINETGAIFTSALLHSGWDVTDGKIRVTRDELAISAHAFVIVGYNQDGFYVLNSWGAQWGRFENYAGVALWPYEDWASHVLDGWVLRLGVPAPNAFDVSIGPQGRHRLNSYMIAGSTPCSELLGHYLHLEDGRYVRTGSYPSSEIMSETTLNYLSQKLTGKAAENKRDYDGILLWIPGNLEGLKQTVEHAVRRKTASKELGLYPINLIWSSDFVEDAMESITAIFEKCVEQVGKNARHLDYVIENNVRGIGRAYWKSLERSARRSAKGRKPAKSRSGKDSSDGRELGIIAEFINDCASLCAKRNVKLHIVCEGAGALVLDQYLDVLNKRRKRGLQKKARQRNWLQFNEALASLQLILPAIEIEKSSRNILRLVETMSNEPVGTTVAGGPCYQAAIYHPSDSCEERLRLGPYSRSILHLVANAMAGGKTRSGTIMLGTADAAKSDLVKKFARNALHPINAGKGELEQLTQIQLTHSKNTMADVHQHIKECMGQET